ncbi:MAG TPA: STAS domain-containing protein [Micromonosporaceae bacterium]|nr:STAS domain-containing protein [Micromonosporaceae bacterium]
MPLEIQRESRPSLTSAPEDPGLDPVVLAISGELDLGSLAELEEAATAAIADGTPVLLLDLSGLTFCDSTGLGLFVRLHKRMQQRGGRLGLVNPQAGVLKVLKLTGLDAALHLYPDIDVALTSG